MSDFFGGGGSWKSSVDNYYTFTQTSGGGSSGGGKGCGTVIVIVIIIAAVLLKSLVAVIIALGSIGLLIGIVYLILKRSISRRDKTNQSASAAQTDKSQAGKHDDAKTQNDNELKPVPKTRAYEPFGQAAQKYREDTPDWEGGRFIGCISIAGTGYIDNKKAADESTAIGDKLTLVREPDNPHDSNAIIILNKTGMKLGYVPKNQNAYPAECMDHGTELFARLRAKSFTGNHLTMTAELFVRDERAAT